MISSKNGSGDGIAIMLISDSFDRVHYAFMLAVSALAVGREMVLFAGGYGVRGLARDWSALSGAQRDVAQIAAGVAGFDVLRASAEELGATIYACEAGLKQSNIAGEELMSSVKIVGIPTFLEASRGCQVFTI